MASITFLKNLKNGNKTLLEILNSFIFGNKKINVFDPNTIYRKGDLILVDTEDGLEVRQALIDIESREYEETQWSSTIVKDWFINLSNNIASISKTQPIELENVLWFVPIKYYTDTVPNPDVEEYPSEMTTLFSPRAFAVGEYEEGETPSEIDTGVFFDIESSEIVENYTSDDRFVGDPEVKLTSNDHMLVDDDPPTNSDTLIWGDTDLTDNI